MLQVQWLRAMIWPASGIFGIRHIVLNEELESLMSSTLSRSLMKMMRPDRVRLLDDLERVQWLPADDLADMSRKQLDSLLRHACTNVPFYRDFCAQAGLNPETVGHRDLAAFPLRTKHDLSADMDNYKNAVAPATDFHANATGGSSGSWFKFFIDAGTLELRAASDLRGRAWTGWRPGDKQAVLWGSPKDNNASFSFRGRMLNKFVHRSLILNTYDMSDAMVAQYALHLKDYKPAMMLGYASALAFLADYLKRENMEIRSPRGIVSSAETLTDTYRETIETYFGCNVLNRYGSREFAIIAQQCEEVSHLHIINDRVHVEILRPDGSTCDVGERGEIVVTDLDNYALPFIRYRTGDLARTANGACACGRGFPLLESVEGRTSELIVGMNGKYYSCQSPRLFGADIAGIGQMQLIQESIEEITVRVVPNEKYSPETKTLLAAHMHELVGETRINIVLEEKIQPAPSGKYPFTISKVSPFD
jgi:phenylacetate-coenzyme A ligase PaaK-like adenylate-forming protein